MSRSGPSPGAEGYWEEIDQSPGAEVVHISDDHDEFIGRDGGSHLLNTEIGERGWLGNPYVLEEHGGDYTREESVAAYADAVLEQYDESPEFRRALWELRDARLACFCRHEGEESPACHGDVLVHLIEVMNRRRSSREEGSR